MVQKQSFPKNAHLKLKKKLLHKCTANIITHFLQLLFLNSLNHAVFCCSILVLLKKFCFLFLYTIGTTWHRMEKMLYIYALGIETERQCVAVLSYRANGADGGLVRIYVLSSCFCRQITLEGWKIIPTLTGDGLL